MLKKLFFLTLLVFSTNLLAQEVVFSDEFDNGDSKWTSGWIDAANVTVAFSIDANSVLSGTNSYKAVVTDGDAGDGNMWHIQRNADLPLTAGYEYTLSFMAVSDVDGAQLNVLFEIAGDPYTKRLDDTTTITTTPQTFTFTVPISENVPTNMLKFMYGGAQNSGKTIWLDNIVVSRELDPALITQWGEDALGYAWSVENDASTAPGSGSIAGTQPMATNGSSLFGGFDALQATTTEAVVASGQLTFVGDPGPSYTALRFALTYQDSLTLNNPLTDTAAWIGKGKWLGYEFTPRSGSGVQRNGAGGNGSVWGINNGNWSSTYSNGGGPLGPVVNQAPRNAEILAGTYNWAVSVIALDDTSNEIRWSLVEVNNKYWFAGSVIDTAFTTQFNGIGFWTKDGEHTQLSVMNARAELGSPIDIPEAPWQKYYIDQWGEDALGYAWSVTNDTNTLVGDGGITGTQPMASNGSTIFGSFGQAVKIPSDKALVVKGDLEFTGDPGDSYTALRFAIVYQDSLTLNNALTDSAAFVGAGKWYGYEFTPRSGSGVQPNGAGGNGSVWGVNGGNWSSTYSNAGGIIGPVVNQAPRNASILGGTYKWAISVQAVDDTTNEVRWYLVKKDNSYWFGGTVMAPAFTDKLNGIGFWTKDGEHTALDIIAAEIDLNSAIDIPEAPWEAYYIENWGEDALGYAWSVLNDSNTIVGDAGIAGEQPMATNGSSLFGGLFEPVKIRSDKALIINGELKFTGDPGDSYTALRFAIVYQDSLTLNNALTDSAAFVGKDKWYGYEFTPRSGSGVQPNGAGGNGSVWGVNNGNWSSTYSNAGGIIGPVVNQAPRNAAIMAGTYKWAMSVQAVDDSTNEVRWYLVNKDNSYWFGGTVMAPAFTDKINGIGFWTKDGGHTQMDIIAAKVDFGEAITIPKAPWEDFYVDTWGIYGGNDGGWSVAPIELSGNVDLVGTAAPTGWAVVRGDLGNISPEPDVDIFVLQGKIILTGGGFEPSASLRFGLFNGDAGSVAADTNLGFVWTGADDNNTGYLILAQEGSNNSETWATGSGNWGKVENDLWYNYAGGTALGDKAPLQTAGGAGTYEFKICVAPYGDGTTNVIWTLQKADGSYYMDGGIKDNAPLTSFNSFVIGIGDGASATSLSLEDVEATMADDLIPSDIQDLKSALPTKFALNQNYPNPFNPTTTIEYALPKDSDVKLVIYDILGSRVTELVNGVKKAGYYKVNFNASNLASGIYFYTIKAGDFVTTKKLVLLK